MRETAPIFNAAKQQGIAVGEPYCTSVEYAVNGVRPILSAEDRIAGMTSEEWGLGIRL
jgi:hypothetical protein